MVRNTRDELVEAEHGHRSMGGFKQHQPVFRSVVEQSKDKHAKLILRLMNYETMATEKLQERHNTEIQLTNKEAG
jgi:hypothetical protein